MAAQGVVVRHFLFYANRVLSTALFDFVEGTQHNHQEETATPFPVNVAPQWNL